MRSNKLLENSEMSSVEEAADLVRAVAGPREISDSVKAAINRAARRLGFSVSRTHSIWYRNARRIDAEEIDRLRERAARVEAERTVSRMVELRASLAASDAEFHRPLIDQLERTLTDLGVPVGAMAVRED